MIIYKITNLLDGKIYVGQTKKTLEKRIEQHKHNKHSCIGKAIQDLGLENFSYEIIEECNSIEELLEREKFWIRELDSKFPNGYNKSDGGEGVRGFSPKIKNFAVSISEKGLNVEIGKRVRVIRELQKKTREQLSELAEISPNFLFEIETGRKSMKAQTIINLAKALKVTTGYILTGSNDAPTSKILKNLEELPPNILNLAEKFLEIFSKGATK